MIGLYTCPNKENDIHFGMGIKLFDGGTDGYRSVLRDFGSRVSEVLLLLEGWIGLVKDRPMKIFTLVKGRGE
jgi:hypothetical protein